MPLRFPRVAVVRPWGRHRPACGVATVVALAAVLPTAARSAGDEAPAPAGLDRCAVIGPPLDRLACYDRLAGRAPQPAAPDSGGIAAAPPAAGTTSSASAATPLPAEPLPAEPRLHAAGDGRDDRAGSPLSRYWELDAADKRGRFNFVGYRANYVLPLHVTTRINRAPSSPTQAAVSLPNYRNVEAKFQVSVRAKLLQDVGLPGADLWAGYTQQAMWQVWNGADSKPFRNTDYEPELLYVVPVPTGLDRLPFGWRWRMMQLGVAHQSNGQADPLSRSWNRVWLGAGFERGGLAVTVRLARRFDEPAESDNNPDLVSYRGHGDLQATWTSGLATTSLLVRTTLAKAKIGAAQLEWSYPVSTAEPGGLRWFVQVFSGYGETLTDYNFRQTSVGAGVSFLQF